jgi:hypothetical protein
MARREGVELVESQQHILGTVQIPLVHVQNAS